MKRYLYIPVELVKGYNRIGVYDLFEITNDKLTCENYNALSREEFDQYLEKYCSKDFSKDNLNVKDNRIFELIEEEIDNETRTGCYSESEEFDSIIDCDFNLASKEKWYLK